MREQVIIFDHVNKSYPLYHHIAGGLKGFFLNLPKSIDSIKNSRYEALRDISFYVYKGETFGVIGKNGSGKSTTLGLIAGVLKPTKGKVVVKGRISPLLELGAGFHPELSGRENIVLNGVLCGLSRMEVLRKIDRIIEFSEIGDFIDQPVRTYSSGMTARLGFSVIANLDPEILLIDEVLAVGDIDFQEKCTDKMMEFKKNGVTIVIVSHSMTDVEKVCDRVLWIDDCEVKMTGDPKQILAGYSSGKISYRPAGRVTREEAAAFIIRALYGEKFACASIPYFSDVLSTDNFFKYIQKMKELGITSISDTYSPKDNVTREQMAAFLVRAIQCKAKQDPEKFSCTTTPYFSDVPSTDTFFRYVQKLKDEGITNVTDTYNPDAVVTRGEMAVFVSRALYGENFTYTKVPWFSDVAPTDYCFKHVQKLKDEGIVTGYGN
jgi:lipopolysaccharide transport system ATP-binding protein